MDFKNRSLGSVDRTSQIVEAKLYVHLSATSEFRFKFSIIDV